MNTSHSMLGGQQRTPSGKRASVFASPTARAPRDAASPAPTSHLLQRYVGNQKLQRSVKPPKTNAKPLVLGPVHDKYEAEASAVADSVMPELDASVRGAVTSAPQPAVQRMPVQKLGEPAGAAIAPEISADIQNTTGGARLDGTLRRTMESRLGVDLSGVRLHTGARADMLNRQLDARAFTRGKDIFFRSGEYAPGTSAGKHLLAHEITHVAQQGSGSVQREVIQRVPKVSTAGGDWKANVYGPIDDGAEIELEFAPNKHVKATKIGLIQSSLKIEQGVNYDTRARQMLESGDPTLQPAQKRKAQRSDGTRHIDRHIQMNNPIYGAANLAPGQNISDTPKAKLDHSAKAQQKGTMNNYQLGHRYRKGLITHKRSAKLYDMPKLPGATEALRSKNKPSEMTFETTAIALSGPQAGQYYGSVEWGWKLNNIANGVELINFAVKSQGSTSKELRKTMQNWNQGEFRPGEANPQIPLPAQTEDDGR